MQTGAKSYVLVVEDDARIAELISLVLDEAGFASQRAKTGMLALSLLGQHPFDIVILDRMLPDMEGDDVCRVIKERNDGFLPVLMLTARTTLADRISGLNAGADDYLVKPFHTDELLARLHALLRIRAAERKLLAANRALDDNNRELRDAYEKLSSTQAQLAHASRLAAMGELVAGIAHELNNPLAVILGNAELMKESVSKDNEALDQVIEGAQRARRVLRSLMHFARQGSFEKSWYNLPLLTDQVMDLCLARLKPKGIQVVIAVQEHMPLVWVDGPRIQQVILDLLLNAEYALRNRPEPQIRVTISTAEFPLIPPPILPQHVALTPTDHPHYAVIDVADNGSGLPSQVVERLFLPFVTSKPFGQGSGLSLSIAHGIMEQHGGTLLANTLPNQGTTFRMAMPLDARDS